ncbi:MAG TPA: hypothetical protein VE782_02950, partial [Myxococcaceae bacterium]|nr:hypothetical protein [Myxococcaceae bacterium]
GAKCCSTTPGYPAKRHGNTPPFCKLSPGIEILTESTSGTLEHAAPAKLHWKVTSPALAGGSPPPPPPPPPLPPPP